MNFTSNLTVETIVAGVVAFVVGLILLVFIFFQFKNRIKPEKFRSNWLNLQKKLSNQDNWLEAVVEADELLDKALKKRKIKGKTTGEMLVNAEKLFSSKDEIWFAHKYVRKHESEPNTKLNKKDVKRALIALRQGIKDLGAFDGKK